MDSAAESLELLENKIHFLAVKLTQVIEENHQLQLRLNNVKNKNHILSEEVDNLKAENNKLKNIKSTVRDKIIGLISQLSPDSNIDSLTSKDTPKLDTREIKANKSLPDNSLKDTVFDFFSEEEL